MKSFRTISIDFLFIILIIILLGVSYLSYTRINNLVKASNSVSHSRLIEFNLEHTLLYLKDAETGQREFLLTKDSVFLHLYYDAFGKIQNSIQQLDSLTTNNAQQKKNLLSIKEIAGNKLRLENLLNSSVYDKSIQITPIVFENKKVMDSMRKQIRLMASVDGALLKNEVKERNQFAFVTPFISIIIIFTTLLIASLSYFINRKDKLKLSDLNMQLKEKNMALEQSNMELSSFNYVASHDLQEPLRKIQLFSKRIIDRGSEQLSTNATDDFNRIRLASERMQNLIKSLLGFSEAIVLEIVFVKTDLNETLKEVESALKESINLKQAKIESGYLPTLNAVPAQIHQLFLHLIGNALKYSRPGIPPVIKITAEKASANEAPGKVKQNGALWKISIQDNGIGFEQKYQYKIFEIFQRLHGTADYEGTGIGLAICRKIVHTHNGTISATGMPGVGATFTLFLSENNR